MEKLEVMQLKIKTNQNFQQRQYIIQEKEVFLQMAYVVHLRRALNVKYKIAKM